MARSRLAIWFVLAGCLGLAGAAHPATPSAPTGPILFECGCSNGAGDGLFTMWPDGTRIHRAFPRLAVSSLRWSRDGRRLVFRRARGAYSVGIWTTRANGHDLRQVTSDQYDRSPVWSPDGRRIVFVKEIPWAVGNHTTQLWIVDANGRHAHRLIRKQFGYAPDWSPNSDRIAFAAIPGDPLDGWLYVVHANGKGLHRLPWRGEYPRWSPNGRQLAFTQNTPHGWVATILTLATNSVRTINVDLNAPFVVWSPSGKDLLVSFWDRSAPDDEIYNVTKLRIRDAQRRFLLQHLGGLGVDDWRR